MKSLFVLILCLVTVLGFAQQNDGRTIEELSLRLNQESLLNSERLERIADSLNLERVIKLNDDKYAYLVDFRENRPLYVTTHNLQARKTTGVETLQSPEFTSAPLLGQKMSIGVWDGGLVFTDHVEFGGRVSNLTGTSLSNHATHVTGTIAASGLNPQAMGMAPAATIKSYFGLGSDDLSLMANEAAQGMVLSNHSYGLVLGWEFQNNTWVWLGGEGNTDARFGDYSSYSRTQDEIAYNAPYYLILRSAGNDRSDTGDGSRPPDGPFDCIGPNAVSKNVLTIGAITGFDQYQGPTSAVMSTFSSWGPTDDGRIKPDVVGDGVGVFSTSSSGGYTTLQGTSMATPNVTGTLALLQQYYRQSADTFMTAAALKALVVHTAREAGLNDGPDYSFGWGVVNVVDAFNVLKGRNEKDTLLIQSVLSNGTFHEYEIFSDGKKPLIATIAWTDPPGSPSSTPGDTRPMLVNDLDIRLVDDFGSEFKPWTLDPSNPSAPAASGDNYLDNVEKIEFMNPIPGRYRVRVYHKNSLQNALQAYSLIFTGSSIASPEQVAYWIPGSGQFQGQNWSTISGGSIDVGLSPTDKTIVFDHNSELVEDDVITLNQSLTVKNFIWNSLSDGILDLGGNTLTIENDFFVSNQNLSIKNGVLNFLSTNTDQMNLNFNGEDGTIVILNNSNPVLVNLPPKINELQLMGDNITLTGNSIVADLIISAKAKVINSNLNIQSKFEVQNPEFESVNSKWHFENAEVAGSFSANLGEISFTGNSLITTSIIAEDALFSGTVELGFDCSFDDLIIQGGSNLNLLESITLNISNSLILESAFQNEISIFSSSIESQPTLKLAFRDILCVDYVSLSNLIVASEGIFNLGANSIASNVDGIFSEACEELVLPNFRLEQNCANSAIQFINNSIGAEDVDLYEWDFGDDFVNSQGNRTVSNPIVIFNESGEYTVTLKIQKGDLTFQFTDQVSITSNNLTPINLINVDDGLAASILQTQYVWYKDGILIPDQTSRIYQPVESGSYQVGYTSSGSVCGSRISPPFLFEVITSVNETINSERQFAYPNPTTGNIIIESVNGIKRFSVTDLTGLLLMSKDLEEAQSRIVIDLSTFGSSFYLITVFDLNGKISNHKIVKQ